METCDSILLIPNGIDEIQCTLNKDHKGLFHQNAGEIPEFYDEEEGIHETAVKYIIVWDKDYREPVK